MEEGGRRTTTAATLTIGIHGSCQSYRQHYLDLDPTYRDANGLPLLRMTFDWHKNEQKMLAFMYERCVEIAKAMKPSPISARTPIPAKYSIIPYQSTHNIGGAVMGADPATSVVNKYLQSWDVPNVFVVGGSAFPQNAAQWADRDHRHARVLGGRRHQGHLPQAAGADGLSLTVSGSPCNSA